MPNPRSRPELRLVRHSQGQQEEQCLDRAEYGDEDQATGIEDGTALKRPQAEDRLLTPEQVAERLNVTTDWVWDHSSRRAPFLPVIRIGHAKLRYRSSEIEQFIAQRERASNLRRKRG
jgi:predicted DNA-binding transcriptional regulator AlpA